jgi:hypothetical protein
MAFTIVSIYLLAVAIVLIAICFIGAKKSGADKEDNE